MLAVFWVYKMSLHAHLIFKQYVINFMLYHILFHVSEFWYWSSYSLTIKKLFVLGFFSFALFFQLLSIRFILTNAFLQGWFFTLGCRFSLLCSIRNLVIKFLKWRRIFGGFTVLFLISWHLKVYILTLLFVRRGFRYLSIQNKME